MFDIPLWLWLQALVQGVTEFLPVSSTGHLGLGWAGMSLLGLELPPAGDQQLIDIGLHVGTLGAVMVYFFRDIVHLAGGGWALFTPQQGRQDPRSRLFIHLVIASVPAFIAGVIIADFREAYKNDLALIAATTLIFGILLWISDRFFRSNRSLRHLSVAGAIFVGLMQCLALIPGVSRSGITITAGRFLGLERPQAVRFSMLLSIPLILGAGLYGTVELAGQGTLALGRTTALAALIAFICALSAIHVLMILSRRVNFLPFVLYRLFLGILIYAALIFDWLPNA